MNSNFEKLKNVNDLNKKYDYYSDLLTSTQREYFEMHFFHDMSLQEIADEMGRTRQAIKASIDSAVKIINKLENALNLYGKTKQIQQVVEKLKTKSKFIEPELAELQKILNGDDKCQYSHR